MKNELRTLFASVAILAFSACGSNTNSTDAAALTADAEYLAADDAGNVKLPGRGANAGDGGLVMEDDAPVADAGDEAGVDSTVLDGPSLDGSPVAMDVATLAHDAGSRDVASFVDVATTVGGLDASTARVDGRGEIAEAGTVDGAGIDTTPTETATETATSTTTTTSTATSTMTTTSTGTPTLTLTFHPTLTFTNTITRIIVPPTLTTTGILTTTLIDTPTSIDTNTLIETSTLTRSDTAILLTNTNILTTTQTLGPITTPIGPVLGGP